jgi:sulfur carrier protein
MKITLNGQIREFEPTLATIGALLAHLGFEGKPVVVEHNQTALLPREIHGVSLKDGDVVELIQITAGG